MALGSIASFILVKLGVVKPEEKMTRELYFKTVFPIALLFAGVLWLGNAAYLYLSVSFIQMTKVTPANRMHRALHTALQWAASLHLVSRCCLRDLPPRQERSIHFCRR